jgi:hypothetical protein
VMRLIMDCRVKPGKDEMGKDLCPLAGGHCPDSLTRSGAGVTSVMDDPNPLIHNHASPPPRESVAQSGIRSPSRSSQRMSVRGNPVFAERVPSPRRAGRGFSPWRGQGELRAEGKGVSQQCSIERPPHPVSLNSPSARQPKQPSPRPAGRGTRGGEPGPLIFLTPTKAGMSRRGIGVRIAQHSRRARRPHPPTARPSPAIAFPRFPCPATLGHQAGGGGDEGVGE